MQEELLVALRRMIELDDTLMYLDAEDGTFNPEDENALWLDALQKSQAAYFNATKIKVENANGIFLGES